MNKFIKTITLVLACIGSMEIQESKAEFTVKKFKVGEFRSLGGYEVQCFVYTKEDKTNLVNHLKKASDYMRSKGCIKAYDCVDQVSQSLKSKVFGGTPDETWRLADAIVIESGSIPIKSRSFFGFNPVKIRDFEGVNVHSNKISDILSSKSNAVKSWSSGAVLIHTGWLNESVLIDLAKAETFLAHIFTDYIGTDSQCQALRGDIEDDIFDPQDEALKGIFDWIKSLSKQ